jgi:DNA-binding winged helix-turn-helix (wHTH) protein/tetratricopeptide (TPR) repeat protein
VTSHIELKCGPATRPIQGGTVDQSTIVEFDGWTLNRNSRELFKAGRSIRLRPQPLQVLEELLARPGDVVSRTELIAKLWPKGIVDFDTALNSAVRRLRRALSDDADRPKYIETIPRKGYRFIGTLGSLSDRQSVSLGQEAAYAVRSPRPSQQSLLRAAIMVVMFCAIALLGISADSPDQPTSASVLFPKTLHGFQSLAPPSSAPLSERLEKARYFLARRSHGDLDVAQENFEQVLGLDPTSATAYAGLASIYWLKTVQSMIPAEDGLPKVKAFAERALAFDADDVEALLRLALYSRAKGDRAKSDTYFRHAFELKPEDPLGLAIRSSFAFADERLEESIELSRRAVTAAPLNLVARYNLASALYVAGQFDEALKTMYELIQFDATSRADILAYMLVLNGRHQAALDLVQGWPDGPDKSQALALAQFGLGNVAEADKALESLIRQVHDTEPLRIAEVYAYRRAFDQAFDWLRAPKKSPYARGIRPPGALQTVKYSPLIAPLRSDPRWAPWLAANNSRG